MEHCHCERRPEAEVEESRPEACQTLKPPNRLPRGSGNTGSSSSIPTGGSTNFIGIRTHSSSSNSSK